ncbi:site-specific DNA-methyltransferase [Arthrobacter sp. efr-133-TYG-120]|uniref:DNA methyltransferase n=1 Tax=Arthrobacter sp. efr-133-TYG-120 TaxID=3040280 RepID=UPI00254E3485|nr:site-specific DNA-methyltransferase [Arthrobacter sp. efr-133-TYG-120]
MTFKGPVCSVIQGDAREVLPELARDGLAGQVKLAYLDPPYNTQRSHRFRGHYRDNRTKAEWAALIEDVLVGVRELLCENGSVWLQTNASELGTAQRQGDEVFGQDNFVGTITWEKTRRPSFSHAQLASTTDFLLIYGKCRAKLAAFTSGKTESGKRVPVAHRGNKRVEICFPPKAVRFGGPDGVYAAGDHSSPGIDAWLQEDVTMANGRNVTPLRLMLPSRYSPESVYEMIAKGGDFFIPRKPFRPSYIARGGAPKLISNLWSWRLDSEMETNEDGAKQQSKLFPSSPFPYAKPEGLLRRIIECASEPGDIVLDCFAGSGTTPAVAEQMGRRWLAIEENSDTIRDYVIPRLAGRVQAQPRPVVLADNLSSLP